MGVFFICWLIYIITTRSSRDQNLVSTNGIVIRQSLYNETPGYGLVYVSVYFHLHAHNKVKEKIEKREFTSLGYRALCLRIEGKHMHVPVSDSKLCEREGECKQSGN